MKIEMPCDDALVDASLWDIKGEKLVTLDFMVRYNVTR